MVFVFFINVFRTVGMSHSRRGPCIKQLCMPKSVATFLSQRNIPQVQAKSFNWRLHRSKQQYMQQQLVSKDTDYKTLSFCRRSLQMLSRFQRGRILQISDNRKFRLHPSEKHKSSEVQSHRKSDQGSDFILAGRGSSQVTHPGYMNNPRAICLFSIRSFVRSYQSCTTLSPLLGVKVTFLWNIIACCTESLSYSKVTHLHYGGQCS